MNARRPYPPSAVLPPLPPGSDIARRAGCTCSMIRNYFGRGIGDARHPHYEIADGCPVHAAGSGRESTRS